MVNSLDLTSVGMERGLLYETVITTVNDDGTPNAAPIGVICKDVDEIVVYLHEGSSTVGNIKRNKIFMVNLVRDPIIFVESTLGDLSKNYFKAFGTEFCLKNADACFIGNVTNLKDVEREDQFGISVTSVVKAKVSEVTKNRECVEPLNRAIYGIIEGLVYLTRMDMVTGDMEKLYRHRMSEISRIVNKVGGTEHKNAMKRISDEFATYE